jgi:lipid II:glycine glycyltransferase (peptidoglycan interpeptide bridge formation enzyme)
VKLPLLTLIQHDAERPAGEGSPARWDADVTALGGSLLQSWDWGAFKARHGWEVERIRVEVGGRAGLAQVLFRRMGPLSIGYLPRGPVLGGGPEVASALFVAIDAACWRRRAVFLIVEPERPLPFCGTFREMGFVCGPQPFQPARSTWVPLEDDAALLARMRRDTRANVRRAERDGVVIERAAPTPEAVRRFYDLLAETSARNAFEVHDAAYYDGVLRQFGDRALLSFARVHDEDAVGLIAVRHGSEAIYLYGGSSAARRGRGAAALLQFDAMRWAREHGCTRYDLWGLPDDNPPALDLARGRVATSRGDRWDGLYQFKTGFGGEIDTYPRTLERRYRPLLAWIARKRFPRYRTVLQPVTGVPLSPGRAPYATTAELLPA